MTEREALILAICTTPEDDLPRLVFADWLDENGEPERAKFIRVQCEVAKSGDGRCNKCGLHTGVNKWTKNCRGNLCRLRRLEYESSKRFLQWDWSRPVPPGVNCIFRRGFVDEIHLTMLTFLGGPCDGCSGLNISGLNCFRCNSTRRITACAQAVFSAHPVTKVILTDRKAHEDGGEWQWASATETSTWRFDVHQSSLPWELARHLKGGRYHPETRSIVAQWWYDDLDLTRSDLSSACVLHGRELAGLA